MAGRGWVPRAAKSHPSARCSWHRLRRFRESASSRRSQWGRTRGWCAACCPLERLRRSSTPLTRAGTTTPPAAGLGSVRRIATTAEPRLRGSATRRRPLGRNRTPRGDRRRGGPRARPRRRGAQPRAPRLSIRPRTLRRALRRLRARTPKGVTELTLLVYLTGDVEGGETCFYRDAHEGARELFRVAPEVGKCWCSDTETRVCAARQRRGHERREGGLEKRRRNFRVKPPPSEREHGHR